MVYLLSLGKRSQFVWVNSFCATSMNRRIFSGISPSEAASEAVASTGVASDAVAGAAASPAVG